MRTIDWWDGAVRIIDQTRLPEAEVVLDVRDVDDLVGHIRSLAVRGAMALGVAGAMGMALAATNADRAGNGLDLALDVAAEKLTQARPTAVNLGYGVRAVQQARAEGAGVDGLLLAALAIRDQDIAANRAIAERGAEVLAGARRLLTHCNAGALAGVEQGTALGVIGWLHRSTPLETVYVCETRPLLQGSRLTAWELSRAGVPHLIIIDSAAAGLILSGQVDAVVVGADRIAANGDVANKVGTVAHALAARHAGIPFLVAAPESTVDVHTYTGADIPIELRDEDEVLNLSGRRVASAASHALNPAFDVTPAELVTAIVTERRVLLSPAEHPPAPPKTQLPAHHSPRSML